MRGEQAKASEAFKLFAAEYTLQGATPKGDTKIINKAYKNLIKKEKLLGNVPTITGDVDQDHKLIHDAQKVRIEAVLTSTRAYFADRNANHE